MPIPCHFDYQPSLSFLMLRSHNHINLVHSHRFCHTFHVPHAINRIYRKLSNSKQLGEENSMACSGSRLSQKPSLRREGFPRSSYRLSLRRDRDKDLGRFSHTRLSEPSLAWARQSLAQRWGSSLGLNCSDTPRLSRLLA